jgi:hypothetical protein
LLFSSAASTQSGLLVHDNYIHDAVCDGISFAGVDPSQGTVLAYNNIVQHVGAGPAPAGGESTYACINAAGSGLGTVQILNNSFYDCGARANADSGGISAATPVVVINNIFALVSGESYVTSNTHTSVLSGSNNLFWGAGAIPAPFTSSLDADPLFIDVANTNFHVQPSSPAIDAGTTTSVGNDYDGVSRPQGKAYDIGAYESTGAAQGAGQLAENPSSLNFGTVNIGASSTQSLVVSNTGNVSVTISQMNVTGAGFSASGLNLPATLASGQSTTLTVTFSPQAAGAVTGSVAFVSNAANATSSVQLSGTGASVLPPGCSTSTASWQSSSFAAQSGTFTAQWDSTPSAQAIAAFTGLSSVAAGTWTDNAAMVRFNADNTMQALKGGNPDAYTADTTINYTAGNSYHFRVVVNVAAHTYSVFVTPQGGTETALASNYPFRSTLQTVTGLSFVNTIFEVGSGATLCNFGVVTSATNTLSASPASLSFGNVAMGSNATQNVTVTASTGSVTISQATASASFSVSGPTLPMTLAAGTSTTFPVKFAPTAVGSVAGSLSLTSNASGSPTVVSLSGTGTSPAGTLAASPASVSFGNVAVGSSATQNVTVTASTSSVTISQAAVTAGFAMSGPTLPTTLAAGQSATFSVKFSPTAAGSVAGSLSLTSNASNSPTAVALSGTGTSALPPGCSSSTATWQSSSFAAQTGTFTAQWDSTPSAQAIAAFTGLSSAAAGTWTDNAAMVRFNADNTIQALKGGNPDAYTADTAINYTAGSSYHFRLVVNIPSHSYSVFITPQGGTETLLASNYPFRSTLQTVTGLSFANTIFEVGSGATLCNFGVTATPGTLSASPSSVNFGNVVTGSSATQNVTVTASTSSVIISQATATAGFTLSGPTLPATLAAGQSATFQVKFAPTATGSVTGSLSITSNASGSPTVVSLSGTGATPAGTLAASPTSVSFGNVAVGSSATQNVTVTASVSSVTLSQAAVSAGFGLSGPTLPMTLAAGQSATFSVKFSPTAAGSVAGSLSLTSSASGSPTAVSLSGTGTAAAAHSTTLNWVASNSNGVVGYFVYRGTQTGGPYTKLNATAVTGTSYIDNNVTAGATYFYVVDSVSSNGMESVHSSEVSVTIPTP